MPNNTLIMDKDRWNGLQYNYHQMINSLNLIILTDKDSFTIQKSRYLNDIKKEYPISYLKEYLKNIENSQES